MTSSAPTVPTAKSALLARVDAESGQRVMSCYQCGKCTAGCPVAASTTVGPRQVMRAVQLGLAPVALGNDLIWMCLSCQTCSVRCPREIDVWAVMESLRLLAVAEGVRPAVKDLATFHRVFLGSIRRGGRLHELGLGAVYNMLSLRPFKNTGLLPTLLAKRKIGILPSSSKGAAEVQAIFERVAAIEGEARSVRLAKPALAAAAVGAGVLAGAVALGVRREAKE